MPDFSLAGRTALVTGANRGIGLAFARAIAEAGADVVGTSSTIATTGVDFADAVESAGRRATRLEADLSSPTGVDELVASLDARGLEIDVLVNNAGLIRRAPAVDHSRDDWRAVLDVDLTAPFVLAQELGRGMLARGHGRVIFTASMLSFQGGVFVPGYAAAKHGVLGVTRALANEWSGSGVTVNAIAPGYIETDATEALRADPERSASILGRIPAGRWGRPDDLAGAVVFLASPAAAYVTGAVLPVDGGWLGR
jgi:2-dehydro-3-deoxy-D-gluconate 5-dehydrogenase